MKVYFDNPASEPRLVAFDDLEPLPKPAAPAKPLERSDLSNWQVAVIYAMIHTGLMTVIVTQASGDGALGLLSLAFHGAALFVGLCIGLVFRLL